MAIIQQTLIITEWDIIHSFHKQLLVLSLMLSRTIFQPQERYLTAYAQRELDQVMFSLLQVDLHSQISHILGYIVCKQTQQ